MKFENHTRDLFTMNGPKFFPIMFLVNSMVIDTENEYIKIQIIYMIILKNIKINSHLRF